MLTNTRFIFIFVCSFTQSDLLEAKANIVADDVMEPLLSTDEEDRAKCVHLHHSYPIRNQVFPPLKIRTHLKIMFDSALSILTCSDALEAQANTIADEVMDPLISSDEDDRVKCVHPYLM